MSTVTLAMPTVRPAGPSTIRLHRRRHNASLRSLAREGAMRFGGGRTVEDSLALLRWVNTMFGDRVALASSMDDSVLPHLASEVLPGIDVLFVDTGYHFAETLGLRDAVAATRPVNLISVTPVQTVAQQDATYGARLHDRDPDACCALRKVAPLDGALGGYEAWMSGLRRADAPHRANTPVVQWDAKRKMVKINPIAWWSDEDVDRFISDNGVLENPLRQLGYSSIGCGPCTRAVATDEDIRAGRWSGSSKTECGLHL